MREWGAGRKVGWGGGGAGGGARLAGGCTYRVGREGATAAIEVGVARVDVGGAERVTLARPLGLAPLILDLVPARVADRVVVGRPLHADTVARKVKGRGAERAGIAQQVDVHEVAHAAAVAVGRPFGRPGHLEALRVEEVHVPLVQRAVACRRWHQK